MKIKLTNGRIILCTYILNKGTHYDVYNNKGLSESIAFEDVENISF